MMKMPSATVIMFRLAGTPWPMMARRTRRSGRQRAPAGTEEQARSPGPPAQERGPENLHEDRGHRDAPDPHGRHPQPAVHEPGIQQDVGHRGNDQVVAIGMGVALGS